MEQKQKSFNEQLAFGEEGEHEVARYLISKGVSVMPLYQFENSHAPLIYTINTNVVSPDLICFKDDCFMVEVKTKNQWVKFKGITETGFNKKHFDHYKSIQDITGKQVYVFFNHKKQKPLGFYFAKLNAYTRIWDGVVKGKKIHPEMVFYNIKTLSRVKETA